MMNNQTALQTVSHNIANKSTEGFSRQRVDFKTTDAVGWGKTRQGTGATTGAVTRTNNVQLEKQIEAEVGKRGFAQGKSEHLARVEQIFNEQENKGLNRFVSDFFNSFREFSNNPESQAARSTVKETAHLVTKDFQRVSNQLKSLQREVDQGLTSHVTEINAFSEEIADLNGRIKTIEVTGGFANDERDRRDLLVKKLGEKINIRVGEGKDGMIGITAGANALLVSGTEYGTLTAAASAEAGKKRDGNFDIFFSPSKHTEAVRVTDQLTGGIIGGAVEVRDQYVNEVLGRIDELAFEISERVNQAHREGFNKYGESGYDFFRPAGEVRDAAERMGLSDDVMRDLNVISASATAGSAADNRVALVIANLQNERLMDSGKSTMDDYYNGMVGKMGVMTNKANQLHEHQKGVVAQLQNIRESISGVSLDEEALRMIEFQKAFDASAKMVKVADELFDTVINIAR